MGYINAGECSVSLYREQLLLSTTTSSPEENLKQAVQSTYFQSGKHSNDNMTQLKSVKYDSGVNVTNLKLRKRKHTNFQRWEYGKIARHRT
jgi:hypothetical protein